MTRAETIIAIGALLIGTFFVLWAGKILILDTPRESGVKVLFLTVPLYSGATMMLLGFFLKEFF